MEEKEICTHCGSDNTSETEEEYLDVMRDFFCDDCNKDFYTEEQLKLYSDE